MIFDDDKWLARTIHPLRLRRQAVAQLSTMSSNSAREGFVNITLPSKTSAITAGKFVLEQTASGTPLGRFVCGQSYLKNAEAVPKYR